LLVMPIAASTQSPLNMAEPSNWSRFWSYVSLEQSGGGFLINFWPRNSNIFSVQIGDFLSVLGDNFFRREVWVLGWLPALAGALGLFMLWRRNRQLGLAFTLVLFLHAAMTVLYFNIPANFFRPFDRHYLPVFVTLGVLSACGLSVVTQQLAHVSTPRMRAAVASGVMAAVLTPAAQLYSNWTAHDASERHFTRDYAANALGSLPPNAIYFTVGDNDTFPVLYVQAVEGVRPDVRIVNLSLANASWYVDRIAHTDPSFPLSRSADGRRLTTISSDTTVVIPIRSTALRLGLSADSSIPATVTVRPRPMYGSQAVPADTVLLDIVRTNAWRDPITFAITVGDRTAWLEPFARLEGLHWRIVPISDLGPDRDSLRANLLQRYEYRGYADPSVTIDDTSRIIGYQYITAFNALLRADAAQSAVPLCRQAATRLLAAFPPERLMLPENDREQIEARCRS
jgi:hypothetical protein